MQSFKIIALLLLTESGGYVKFTLKYTIVRGEGGYWNFLNVPNLFFWSGFHAKSQN